MSAAAPDPVPHPFTATFGEAQIEDLRARLRATRWPEAAPVGDWSQGVPLGYLQRLCAYWADDYDMGRVPARYNARPQVSVHIDGVDIHAVLARSAHPGAVPLVLTAGWPSSSMEFLGVFDALVDPVPHGGRAADAFHVVCPSLPGYGFSGKPEETGWNVARTADAWHVLMRTLGYRRYLAYGSDWGGGVAMMLGRTHPDAVIGVHLDGVPLRQDPDGDGAATDFEHLALARMAAYLTGGMGYAQIQGTRPQTLGYALADSPAGQCAWITEKFWEWSDHGGDLDRVVSRDELLDVVTLYWMTGTAASSARMYLENPFARSLTDISAARSLRLDVPVGVTMYAGDVRLHSRRWVEPAVADLRHFEIEERGGHFPAMEQPAAFVRQLRRSARAMRKS